MQLEWSAWARARLLPFPDEAWTVESKADPITSKKEALAQAIDLRVAEQWDPKGNHPKDRHGDDLVDACVAGGGLAFATDVAIEACAKSTKGAYELRADAAPWRRLREHVMAASAADREAATKVARKARTLKDDRKIGVAFAFCEPAWVAEDLPSALEEGYGKLCLLASLATTEQARHCMRHLLGKREEIEYVPEYQVVEYAFPFMPNLMRRLDAADAGLVLAAARLAWNKPTRKPWLEIVACLPGAKAKAFLDEHGYVPPRTKAPKKQAVAKSKKPKKK